MKILSAEQIRQADASTILHEPVASIDLMERATMECCKWILNRFDNTCSFFIFCGPGNNGGDGLALARMFVKKKIKVQVFLVADSTKGSSDFMSNLKRFRKLKKEAITSLTESNFKREFTKIVEQNSKPVIIDAIFGSGLNRPPEAFIATVIAEINSCKIPVISIDIPSGLFCDNTSIMHLDNVVKATFTLCFELPKLCLMFPENESRVGEWSLLPIGLDQKFISEQKVGSHFIDAAFAKKLIKKRKKFSHKGTFGHALLVAGSKGKMGAAVLAGRACLRSGAGLLTMHVPSSSTADILMTLPEAMTEPDESSDHFSNLKLIEKYNVIGVGPGIGKHEETEKALKLLIQNTSLPMVIDADALNILSENKTWISFLPKGTIFTPHVLEFERLAGSSTDDFDRHQMQLNLSVKYGIYIVLKGAHTCITSPEGISYFNSTGNPGMAKGGSGDVLTGVITALLAQGYSSLESSILGVYLHGKAADIALSKFSVESFLASDIIENIGEAFNSLKKI